MLSDRFLETIFDKYEGEARPEILYQGVLDEETICALDYHMQNNPFLEAYHYWYHKEDDPHTMCWVDVEGMGYGWIWNDGIDDPLTEDVRHKRLVLQHIEQQVRHDFESKGQTLVLTLKGKDKISYHFVTIDFECEDGHGYRRDMVVNCSPNRLSF